MSDDERRSIAQMAREVVERSTRAQGIPLRITDPAVLERVAALVRSDEEDRKAA